MPPTLQDIIERETAALPSPAELDATALRQWAAGLRPATFWFHPTPYTFIAPNPGYRGPGSPVGSLTKANPNLLKRL